MKKSIHPLQIKRIQSLYQKLTERLSRNVKSGRFNSFQRDVQQRILAKIEKLRRQLSLWQTELKIAGVAALMLSSSLSQNLNAQTANGNEFLVYSHTDSQQNAVVASDDAGNFIIAWTARNKDGDGKGIYGQLYNASGNAIGTEFVINSTTASNQINPAVAMDNDGDFVVCWTSDEQDGDTYGIFAQRFDATGAAQGSEFQVNTSTTSTQDHADVAMDDGGNFIITWHSLHTGTFDVMAQLYNNSGQPINGEFKINDLTTNNQSNPSIAMDSDGDFAVSWKTDAIDFNENIHVRLFSNNGIPKASEFLVNTYTTDTQMNNSIGMDSDGDFVVVWQSYEQDGDLHGIYGQRFDATGNAQGIEFRVNDTTTDTQTNPHVSMDYFGDFVIVWNSEGQDGSGKGILAKEFSDTGTQSGAEFIVNTTTFNDQISPTVNTSLRGDFVVTWNTFSEVYGQRYTSLLQSTKEAATSLQVSVHPNPASSEVHLNLQGQCVVKILDLQGKVLKSEEISNGIISLDHLETGMYQLDITQGESRGITKLMIQ